MKPAATAEPVNKPTRSHTCPPWLGYFLLCPLRRFPHDPQKILSPYVREGMTVLEPGPGMGFFTLDLARMVGASGRVVAIDIEPKMLEQLRRRAARVGLETRIDARLADRESMGLSDLEAKIDFTLAFAVVHEFLSPETFFCQVATASKPGALLLLAEPVGHVRRAKFAAELDAASRAGFVLLSGPQIKRSHAALLRAGTVTP